MNKEPAAHSTPSNAKRKSRSFRIVVVLVMVALAILTFGPSPIDAVVVVTQPAPAFAGPTAANELLRKGTRFAEGKVTGPEDVEVDGEGRVYAGLEDGRIVRILPDGTVEDWATGLGRPLGMDFDAAGNLIVCDAKKGLVSVDSAGKSTVLVDANGPLKLGFIDDCEVAGDGTIYFSDASDKFGVDQYMLDLLEGRPHGRLLAYYPETKETKVLLDGLYFANGVAVAEGDEFVLVNETYHHRVRRYWLTGDKAGKDDIFIENLPGFPDGISASPRGTYWVAMFTTRNSVADQLAPYPWLRNQLAKLPSALWPKPAEYGLVMEVDKDGKILRSFHDPGGQNISNVSSVKEVDGVLYLGNLVKRYVAKLPLADTEAK